MEHTFMTIHNLTPDCNILFASDSLTDILGWRVEDVRGRAVFDFFHPDEVPYARSIHSRGVLLDKAASLHYVRILSVDGRWVSCECCFTVVHDVLVACTSIYRRGEKSERRALEGAQVRRIFSSSPRDPRYHMLEHLSPKFKMPPVEREPRAALILNRFTRNLTVMFATNATASVLGLSPEQIKNKSFYRCIQERCLPDALACLESAKANDSIAYLRFWSRDPRDEEDHHHDDDGDQNMDDVHSSPSDSDEGGAALDAQMDVDDAIKRESEEPQMDSFPSASSVNNGESSSSMATSRSGSNRVPLMPPPPAPAPAPRQRPQRPQRPQRQPLPSIELEAVVSCTSDGLVVILRRARPAIPPSHPPSAASPWNFENGLFAAPWGQTPIRPQYPPEMLYTFRAPLMPQYMPLRDNAMAAGGPPMDHLMQSIREVAVFAWALVGINGNLASYTHGRPRDEAVPPGGLPIWDPTAIGSVYQPPENQAAAKWAAWEQRPAIPQTIHQPGGYYTSSSAGYGQPLSNAHGPPPYGTAPYGPAPPHNHPFGYNIPRRQEDDLRAGAPPPPGPPLSGSTVVPEPNNPAAPRTQPEQPREYDHRW